MLKKDQGRLLTLATLGCVIACSPVVGLAVDSASFELATGNKTKMVRMGAQWEMNKRFWQGNGFHLGAYWDLTGAQWRLERYQGVVGRSKNITDIGITPVFRIQSDTKKGLYGEVGIGAHLLSDLYDNNDRKLSTRFEFGDHLGVGYVLNNNLDIGLKFQHFSNGSIKKPNNGVNFGVLSMRYKF